MRIIVAVDGSDQSHDAVQALAHLKRAETVSLLHVLDVPVPAYPMMMPEISDELYVSMKRSMEEEGERLLRQMQAGLPLDSGPCRTRLEVGKPSEVIVSVAQETSTDLIVMGSRGLSPVKELMVGSVCHRVLTESPCSVLVVSRPLRSIGRILLSLGDEEDVRKAADWLAAKPFRETADITCFTVVPVMAPPWPAGAAVSKQIEQEVVDRGRRFLEAASAKLAALGYRVTPKVRTGGPSAAILEEVEQLRPDLLLLGTRGRQGLVRFVLGSVSHSALHRATCPVLVFR